MIFDAATISENNYRHRRRTRSRFISNGGVVAPPLSLLHDFRVRNDDVKRRRQRTMIAFINKALSRSW